MKISTSTQSMILGTNSKNRLWLNAYYKLENSAMPRFTCTIFIKCSPDPNYWSKYSLSCNEVSAPCWTWKADNAGWRKNITAHCIPSSLSIIFTFNWCFPWHHFNSGKLRNKDTLNWRLDCSNKHLIFFSLPPLSFKTSWNFPKKLILATATSSHNHLRHPRFWPGTKNKLAVAAAEYYCTVLDYTFPNFMQSNIHRALRLPRYLLCNS